MGKGSGTTRSVGSGSKSVLPTEKEFAKVTGLGYGHPVSTYQTSLALVNNIPNNTKIFTGATAKEVKELLKKYIKKLGGSTKVGKVENWIINEK